MSRAFSRSTTSPPPRKISTSSLSKRNSLGNRTAWLLPDRKTRAVDIGQPGNRFVKFGAAAMAVLTQCMSAPFEIIGHFGFEFR
jgi:hypothetical protein